MSIDTERSERYSKALRQHRVEAVMTGEHSFGWHCLTCGMEGWAWSSLEAAEQASLAHHADAVMAVADLELADLRSKVESLAEAWEATDSSAFRSGPLRSILSGAGVGLCDGCDQVTVVAATSDGQAQMCPRCRKVADCEHRWVAEDFEPYCGRCGVEKP